jgi:hypothetical protein
MKAITTQTEIASDGTLRLELATGLAPGTAEVVIVVHPTSPRPATPGQSLSGKYARFARADFDVVAEVREVRRRATQEAHRTKARFLGITGSS